MIGPRFRYVNCLDVAGDVRGDDLPVRDADGAAGAGLHTGGRLEGHRVLPQAGLGQAVRRSGVYSHPRVIQIRFLETLRKTNKRPHQRCGCPVISPPRLIPQICGTLQERFVQNIVIFPKMLI